MFNGIRHNRPEVFERRKLGESRTSYQSFPAQPHPHSMLMVFKKYDYAKFADGFNTRDDTRVTRGGRASGVGLRSANAIELPFPKNLQDATDLRINGFERDPFVETIASKLASFASGGDVSDVPSLLQSSGADLASALSGGSVSGGLNSIAGKFLGTSIKDVASGAQYLLRNSPLMSGTMGKSVDIATNQTLNPRETLAFEGVNLRSHQFTWELFPSNQTDSERIRNIVHMVKKNSLPTVTDLAGISKAFLQYPSTVDLYLLGVNEDHFIKFKTSMVTQFTVDYGAGGGVAIMKGGKPAGVQISMSFQELEIETAHDYGTESNDIQQSVLHDTGVSEGNVP